MAHRSGIGRAVSRSEVPAMKVSDVLKNEHRLILRALDVLEAMALRTAQGEVLDKRDIHDIVAILKGFADRHHQGKEEAVLFPALLQDRQQQYFEKLCSLIFEHEQERSLATGLEEAVETGNPKEFLFCASQLVRKTRAHIDGEDRVLLQLADLVLSPLEHERTVTELLNFDASWQKQVLSSLLKRLEEMETAYLNRPRSGAIAS
jgi:hemerythrin-like domain-containing protein